MSLIKLKTHSFQREVLKIAIPVTLQYVFQAFLSIINEFMVGQLGDISVAANGITNKYESLFTITITAVSAAATILISQYYGKKDKKGVSTSFFYTLSCGILIMILFISLSLIFPYKIMKIYTKDIAASETAAEYLKIIAISFIPYTFTSITSAMFRSAEKSNYPMYSSIISIILNLVANYLLIFGNFGLPKLELKGCAIAIVLSRFIECFILFILFFIWIKNNNGFITFKIKFQKSFIKKLIVILIPIIVTEFLWVLGNNVYMMIYGHLSDGVDAVSAMSITEPIQLISTNLLIGISTAASVIVGKKIGRNKYNEAYKASKRLILTIFIGALTISVIIILISDFYVNLFKVSDNIKLLTKDVLYAFSAFLLVKMLNMMIENIIRTGGNTTYTLVIDSIGTWIIGIPLGIVAAFALDLHLVYVYIFISVEEIARSIAASIIFKRKKWMQNITHYKNPKPVKS